MFEKSTYSQRRDDLKQKFDSGILLFLGNDESPMNYLDNMYKFRQDSTFLYYFGLDDPGLAAVIDIKRTVCPPLRFGHTTNGCAFSLVVTS